MQRFLLATLFATLFSANLKAADSASRLTDLSKQQSSLFARQRVVEPHTLFEFKRLYGVVGTYFQSVTFGAGAAATHDINYASTTITAGTVSGGYSIQQSRTYWDYQIGKGHRLLCSGNFHNAVTGTVKRIGLYDANNGMFFELSGTTSTFGVVIRTSTSGSPVDTKVLSSAFNIDKLDGTGDSKFTLDLTKSNTFFVEYSWLGTGNVYFGVISDDRPIYAHKVRNDNVNLGPFMRTASLPLRCEVRNWGTPASSAYFTTTGWDLESDGGYHTEGRVFQQSRQAAMASISQQALQPVMAIRLVSAYGRAQFFPIEMWATQSTNTYSKMELWLCQGGAGISDPSALTWTAVANGKSAVEYTADSFTLTTTTAGVICLWGDGISSQTRSYATPVLSGFLRGGSDYDGNRDIFVMTYTPISGSGTLDGAGMAFRENF